MTVYDLLILQFIAHMLADYTFQSELWVRHKRRYGFQSKPLYWHALVILFFSVLLGNQWSFVLASVAIVISHVIIDGFKKQAIKAKWGEYAFIFDQLLHIAIITGVVFLHTKLFGINPIIEMPFTSKQLLLFAGFLFCTKPANILIREVFALYKIKLPRDQNTDLFNAGKLIGIIERILTLTFLLYGQFEAVGFLIAAKSILRYEGANTSKTEYVLIGTLLSFGLAILTYVLFSQLSF
jgi:hypothetical protein